MKKHPSRLRVHFSAAKDDWRTPDWLYQRLNEKFKFKADLAADSKNKLHSNYFSLRRSAFDESWPKGYSFCNPPYGRVLVKWAKKAAEQALLGRYSVMLLPARPTNAFFLDYVYPYARTVVLIRGRITFRGAKDPAPFPSMLVVWGKREGDLKLRIMNQPRGINARKRTNKRPVQR